MRSFGITLKNELLRMTRRKKLLAGILISAIIPMLIVLANALSLGRNITLIYREDLIRTALSLFTPMILPLLAIVLVADAFIDEQSKGRFRGILLKITAEGFGQRAHLANILESPGRSLL